MADLSTSGLSKEHLTTPVRKRWRRPEESLEIEAIDLCEVRALIRFARDNGVADQSLDKLTASVPYAGNGIEEKPSLLGQKTMAQISTQYGRLSKITYDQFGVTGRTVLDSAVWVKQINSMIFMFATLFFITGILFSNLQYIVPDTWLKYEVVLSSLELLSPALWGMVGMSIFLLTTYSEIAEGSRFDSRRVHDIRGRMFIGAVFGFLLVNFLGSGDFLNIPLSGDISIELGKIGTAFIAGLGAKAVYEVFMQLILTVELVAKRVLKRTADLANPSKVETSQSAN